jgi:hypothetical protein
MSDFSSIARTAAKPNTLMSMRQRPSAIVGCSGSADMAGNGLLTGFEGFYRLMAAARSLESHLRFAFDG